MEPLGRSIYSLMTLRRQPAIQATWQIYRRLRQAKGLSLSIQAYGARKAPDQWGSLYTTSLAQAVRQSATSPLKGLLLAWLAYQKAPKTILELGTHVGFGTAYLAAGAPQASIQTIEAAPTLAHQAQKLWHLLGIRPQLFIGTFSDILPTLSGPWDLVYIDGDHRPQALLSYIPLLRPKLSSEAWLILDDIFWSLAMYRAWQTLKKMPWHRTQVIFPFGLLCV